MDIFIIFVLIFGNALFVMSEMAIVSSRKVRLQNLANQGNQRAKAALQLAENPRVFLPTVQIGITLIAILSGAFGETIIGEKLFVLLKQIPEIQVYAKQMSTVVAVLIVTYFTLIIGELVPKKLALSNAESIALWVGQPMKMLSVISAPVVYLLSSSTDLVVRMMGIKPSTQPQVTEEEIKVLIEQGTEEGTFEEAEQDILERVFRLGDRRVSALMTPRPEMIWLDIDDSLEENKSKILKSNHSRFPVCKEGLDNVVGIVKVTNLLSRSLAGQSFDLTTMLENPLFVPESTRGLKVLELFKKYGAHLALVVDEYGVIQGLVTVNDILVELVGEIPSAGQTDEPWVIHREDGSWLLDGMLPVEDFFELFDVDSLTVDQRGSYHTLGGFIITNLGRIPTSSDSFEWQNLTIEIVDMDGNRIDKVLVRPQANSVTLGDEVL